MFLLDKKVIVLFLLIFSLQPSIAQDLSSDELFVAARKAAFEEEDGYPKAILLSKQALERSPTYSDIRIFLGRLYTWTDKVEEARIEFQTVLNQEPNNKEAIIAYANLEYWNDNPLKALDVVDHGLKHYPDAVDLLSYRVDVLIELKKWSEAEAIVEGFLKTDPNDAKARALLVKIKDRSYKSAVGISYDYITFDKRFDDPWHLISVDYGRQTAIGTVLGRINYANKFVTPGFQYEIDAYPSFTDDLRAYMNIGYSNTFLFPEWRAGFSLYADLPKSFEIDGGFRYLYFGSDTVIYTFGLGKYYKSFWFNLRTYLTPQKAPVWNLFKAIGSGDLSKSLSFTTRYYYSGSDFIGLGVSGGLSPESIENVLQQGLSTYNMVSYSSTLTYQKTFKTFNVVRFIFSSEHQEYRVNTRGNQYNFGIVYTRRFK